MRLVVAYKMSRRLHEGAVDKAGKPYYLHPRRVHRLVSAEARVVALLHDVLEDTDVTLEHLRSEGLTLTEEVSLDLVTRTKAIRYKEYIRRIAESGDIVAMEVKIADLLDHLAPAYSFSGKDYAGLCLKYRESLGVVMPAYLSLLGKLGRVV